MLTLWIVAAAFNVTGMLYNFFVRPSAGMAEIAPIQRAAPIAVLAVGSLFTLALVSELSLRAGLMQLLTMVVLFWGTTIRAMARPYEPLRRMSILGLSGSDSTDAKH